MATFELIEEFVKVEDRMNRIKSFYEVIIDRK